MALPRHVSHAPQQVWITNHQSSKSSAGLDHSPTPWHNDATDAHIEAHPHLFYQHFDQILSHDPNFQHSHDRGCHLLHRDHLHPVDWGATQHNSARTKALCHNRGIRIVTTEALKLSQPRYQNCVSTLSPIYQRETSINKKQQQKAYLINHPPKPVKKWIFVVWKDQVCVFKNFICIEQNSSPGGQNWSSQAKIETNLIFSGLAYISWCSQVLVKIETNFVNVSGEEEHHECSGRWEVCLELLHGVVPHQGGA